MSSTIILLIKIYGFILILIIFKYIIKRLNNNKINGKYKNLTREERANQKGLDGEYEFINYLNKDNSYYKKIIHNAYINKLDNTTTELDVVLICNFGVYLFEIKNYDGWIFGSRNQNIWTQRFSNGKTYKFNNPINQNLNHLKELENFLKIRKYNLYKSIVFFIGNGELKSYIPSIDSNLILTKNDYLRLNYLIKENNIELLNNFEVDEIYNKLKPLTEVSEITKLNHINRIKSYNFRKN